MNIPTQKDLMNPTLLAIHEAGGSAHNSEIYERVVVNLNLPQEILDIPHSSGYMTKVEHRIAWVRTELKKYGLLNSSRGVWSLTSKGQTTKTVHPDDVLRHNREQERLDKQSHVQSDEIAAFLTTAEVEDTSEEDTEESATWQDTVIDCLLGMSPSAFERLCQRMLRESGFIEVKVTGKSGDGGIDGYGTLQVGSLVTIPVYFQCKRYSGGVNPSTVRDFRGAMAGRGERGLLITTGHFTSEAKKEATREGAQRIDLIDGALLVERLKEFELGVYTKMVEQVTIDSDWFNSI